VLQEDASAVGQLQQARVHYKHLLSLCAQAILATVDAAWHHRLWNFGKICE